MKTQSCFVYLLIYFLSHQQSYAQLSGQFPNAGGNITISTTNGPVQTRGIELQAIEGALSQGQDPSPFELFVTSKTGDSQDRVTFGTLGSSITLDGAVTLNTRASAGAVLHGFWGDESIPRPFPINDVEADYYLQGVTMRGTIPYVGGPITLSSGEQPDVLSRVEISALRGRLDSNSSAVPFDSLVENTVTRWVAQVDEPISVEGELTLPVSATVRSNLNITGINEVSRLQIPVRREQPDLSASLKGTIPFSGGAITIEPINGSTTVRGIDIGDANATLTSGGSAAPFAELEGNRPTYWFARSNTDVTIDGPITLDVSATNAANLVGASRHEDGLAPIDFERASNPGNNLLGSFPHGGGPITLSPRNGIATSIRGVSIAASTGKLSGGGNAAPFETVQENSAQAWAANSSANVVLDGPVTLDVSSSAFASLSGTVRTSNDEGPFSIQSAARGTETNTVSAGFTAGGGPISIWPTAGPVELTGLAFEATRGQLVSGDSPAPLESVVTSTTTRWEVESNNAVSLEGRVTLDVQAQRLGIRNPRVQGVYRNTEETQPFEVLEFAAPTLTAIRPYDGGAITLSGRGDITGLEFTAEQGSLSGGGDATPFTTLDINTDQVWSVSSNSPVRLRGSVTLDVTTSANAIVDGSASGIDGISTLFNVRRASPEFRNQPIGRYDPTCGGAITLESASPVSLRSLSITATAGALEAGDSAAPFETITSSSGTNWAVESLVDVILEGKITLDVEVTKGTSLTGLANDGQTTFSFPFIADSSHGGGNNGGGNDGGTNFFAGIDLSKLSSPLALFVSPLDGQLTLVSTRGPVQTNGLDVQADGPILSNGSNAAPFQFFVTGADRAGRNQVVAGNLASPATIDGAVALDIYAQNGNISATWGNGVSPVALPVFDLSVVPEPTTNFMLLAVAVSLLFVRKRRI